MTPEELANLHRAAFTLDRPWSAAEFRDLLDSPLCHLTTAPDGFALWRVVADEAELLTIATHPDHQRQGIAKTLMQQWIMAASSSAKTAFLEVAADNGPAIALYAAYNFEQVAKRPRYYTRTTGQMDALVMRAPVHFSVPKTSSGG